MRYDENRILFSLPNGDRRANGTIWMSRDDGKTWPVSRSLGPDRFGYSCLARLPDGDIACVYGGRTTPVDSGRVGPYGIVMARVTMEWLED
jgi:sialidase-1